MAHQIQIGLAICTPIPYVRGPNGPKPAMVSFAWHQARSGLSFPTNYNTIQVCVEGEEVGAARNQAVEAVLRHDPRPEFLFFLDYDVIPSFDAVNKLIYRARHYPQYDIFAGVYCSKSSPPEPLIYAGDGLGAFWDWTLGDLILDKITGVHMGLTLIRTSLFDRMDRTKPLFLTRNEQKLTDQGLSTVRGTEDLYFCKRAIEEAGCKILIDTSVLAGHMNHGTGQVFGLPDDSLPVKRAKWRAGLDGKQDAVATAEKKAIDLGAGGSKRQWDGYTVETTDIRPGVADYVQDTRSLNLPDGSYDLVASSHHLEHFARADQATVWAECFRICKPGGKIEHIVPTIEWAGEKIHEGKVDGHVMNVLYGAQEQHGYARELNSHYFGYTKEIAEALAKKAGFVNVSTSDWRDDPKLGYNLIIRGEKPMVAEAA